MKVSQLIPVEHISIGWPSTKNPNTKDKWELIDNIVTFLCTKSEIETHICEKAIELVSDREKSMTTAIGHGIAIPHASIPNLSHPVGACVILDEGIEFEAIDHERVQIIILALLPEKDYKKHIQTLSSIVDLTSHPEIKDRLLVMKTAEDVWNEIASIEETFQK